MRKNIYLETQKKEAYEAQLLQNKVRRRIERLRKNPDASQFAVSAYDEWNEFFKRKPSWKKMSTAERRSMVEDLEVIDKYKTSYTTGAKEHHRTAIKNWGEDYTNLSTSEQSRLWNRWRIVKASGNGNLDSDQAFDLVRYEQEFGRQEIGLDFKPNSKGEIEFTTPESQERYENMREVIEYERAIYDKLKE